MVFIAGHVLAHVLGPRARKNRDAVVGFLSAEDCLVADVVEGREREFRVFHFQLLQAQDLRLMRFQPFDHMRQTHIQRIDIPGSEFQTVASRYLAGSDGTSLAPALTALCRIVGLLRG